MLYVAPITWSQRKRFDLGERAPGNTRMLSAFGLAKNSGANESNHKWRIRVKDNELSIFVTLGLHIELLAEFARDGLMISLSRLKLTAWEFPHTAMTFVCRPETNQKVLTSSYDCGDDASVHFGPS